MVCVRCTGELAPWPRRAVWPIGEAVTSGVRRLRRGGSWIRGGRLANRFWVRDEGNRGVGLWPRFAEGEKQRLPISTCRRRGLPGDGWWINIDPGFGKPQPPSARIKGHQSLMSLPSLFVLLEFPRLRRLTSPAQVYEAARSPEFSEASRISLKPKAVVVI